MSSERGNWSRTRAQKYKNQHAFRNDLHDKTPLQKRLNSFHVCEVCFHCKGIIEWKIKYKKYKPLSKPKTCARCQQRNVKKAYHVICKDCALETRICPKCMKSAEDVEIASALPTAEEEVKLRVDVNRLIKKFPERKRRAVLRWLEKGKRMNEEDQVSEGDTDNDDSESDDDNDNKYVTETIKISEDNQRSDKDGKIEDKVIEQETFKNTKPKARIPYTRDELLEKIEKLRLTIKDKDDFDFSDNCDENEGEEVV